MHVYIRHPTLQEDQSQHAFYWPIVIMVFQEVNLDGSSGFLKCFPETLHKAIYSFCY